MKGILNKLRLFGDVFNLKTIYFNFRYLPLGQAIKFPIIVSRRLRIRHAKGRVAIHAPIHFGMIRIGLDCVGIFDNKRDRSIWQVEGNVIFEGKVFIGHGCKIGVAKDAVLVLGNGASITAHTSITTTKEIRIGSNALISWDVLIMDTDWHEIIDENNKVINLPSPVCIKDNVWIGCRCTILKGVTIASGNIIAAGTIVSRSFDQFNCIIGKNPCEIIKTNVTWHR